VIGIRIGKALALNEYIQVTSCLQDEHANHATSERFFFFTTLGPGCFTTSFAISLMLFSMKSPSYLGMQTIEANGVDSNCESRVLPLCRLFCIVLPCLSRFFGLVMTCSFCSGSTLDQL